MNIKLWEASKRVKKISKLFVFEKYLSKQINKKFQSNYKKIHRRSIENSSDFCHLFSVF